VPPDIAPGAHVAPGAELDDGVRVEPGAVIHDRVVLGRDCLVEAGAVLGKVPRLRPGSSAASERELDPLILEDGVTVCCGAVVTRDVAARDVVMGVPARVIRQVGEDDLIERWR
jgi:acetyltransferase-like isoleucine patch superfamily enzyme